jgi:FkbM family methyltransferase
MSEQPNAMVSRDSTTPGSSASFPRAVVDVIRLLRQSAAADTTAAARFLAARAVPRKVLNRLYLLTSLRQKASIHTRFSGIFRNYDGTFEDGNWRLSLCGKNVIVPLRREFAWLDWDVALSILGHEPELKATYACLVRLQRPPRTVLDVGANYGTHSIVFLSHDVRTISFEPNAACHAFFRMLCEVNDLEYVLEPMAVGNTPGTVDLWYRQREEWLGTTDPSVRDRLGVGLSKITVPRTTIDAYVQAHGLKPDVLKTDTEGTDLEVLQGAVQTLAAFRPVILFESWGSSNRDLIASFMNTNGYRICGLPLLAESAPRVLTSHEFRLSTATNFGGLPTKTVNDWPPRFV